MDLALRTMTEEDLPLIAEWLSESETKKRIGIDNVQMWFDYVANNEHYFVSLASFNVTPIGIVMLETYENLTSAIAFLIAPRYRGQGYSKKMLQIALCDMVPDGLFHFSWHHS